MGADAQKEKEMPLIRINRQWCKACGICIEFCPKDVLEADEERKPVVADEDACIQCMQCEIRCPDFAIVVRSEDDE